MYNDQSTLEILPDGDSLASDPEFHIVINGDVAGRYWEWYGSFDSALADCFPYSSHGYEYLYVGDGYIICADCAKKQWLETGEYIPPWLSMNQDNYGMGEYCEECSSDIIEPGCADCGDVFRDYDAATPIPCGCFHEPTFVKNSGDAQICARCMAHHVVNGHATKTGKLAYEVDLNEPWYGGGTYTAQAAYHPAGLE